MQNITIRALLSLPVVTLGVVTSLDAAQAAALTGGVQFSGGFTSVNFSQTSLTFGTAPDGENQVIVTPGSQTGTFGEFTTAFISNIDLIPDSNPTNNPFLDFGTVSETSGDGLDVFNLTEVDEYQLFQSGSNVAVELAVFGEFVSTTNETSAGQGNLTFQINDTTVAQVQNQLIGGAVFENIGFSGAAFTPSSPPPSSDIPEPATLLGLGLVAGSFLVSRRRLQ